MQVYVYNSQKRFLLDAKAIEALVTEVLRVEQCVCHEVSIHYVGVKKICSLHGIYFNDPTITDCISFPIDSNDPLNPYRVLGEVFVCPEMAYRFVNAHGGCLYEEISLYTVHGLLHLLGYDDIDESDRKVMRQQESVHINNLKKRKLLLR